MDITNYYKKLNYRTVNISKVKMNKVLKATEGVIFSNFGWTLNLNSRFWPFTSIYQTVAQYTINDNTQLREHWQHGFVYLQLNSVYLLLQQHWNKCVQEADKLNLARVILCI